MALWTAGPQRRLELQLEHGLLLEIAPGDRGSEKGFGPGGDLTVVEVRVLAEVSVEGWILGKRERSPTPCAVK